MADNSNSAFHSETKNKKLQTGFDYKILKNWHYTVDIRITKNKKPTPYTNKIKGPTL